MNESRATRYQRLRRRARLRSLVPAACVLALVALTPASRWLTDVASFLAGSLAPLPADATSFVLFIVLLVGLWELAWLPAQMAFTLTVDRAYGRGRSSVEAVLFGELQGAALVAVACVTAGAVVLGAVRIAGTWWWVPAGVVLSGLLAAAHQLAPWLLARTGQLQPLTRPGLASALQAFAARVKVPVAGIDEWLVGDGTRATALVAGLGRRRRVVIASEIARGWSDEEITVVVAHELAHHAYGDLWRSLALNAAILSAALGAAQLVVALAGPALALAGPAELAALPLMALVAALVWGLSAPLRLAQSRRHERRADAFALRVTGGTEAFGAAIRRLTARHLAEERPSLLTQWLSASHPPIAERLALAEALREKPAVDAAAPRRAAAGGSRAPGR